MKICLKLLLAALLVLVLPSMASASIGGNAIPHYSFAEIFSANSTIDLVPTTSGSGNVWGVKCIFPSNAGGATLLVQFTLDGGTTRTITLDPTFLEQDENSRFVTGWIPMDLAFSTSVRIQLSNVSQGTARDDCWASWGTN
jgi:hypothetical protein